MYIVHPPQWPSHVPPGQPRELFPVSKAAGCHCCSYRGLWHGFPIAPLCLPGSVQIGWWVCSGGPGSSQDNLYWATLPTWFLYVFHLLGADEPSTSSNITALQGSRICLGKCQVLEKGSAGCGRWRATDGVVCPTGTKGEPGSPEIWGEFHPKSSQLVSFAEWMVVDYLH